MQEPGLWRILWHGRFLVVLAVAATLGLAALATSLTDDVYEATALLRVGQSTARGTPAESFDAQQADQGLTATYATVLASPSFLERIAPRVAGGRLPAEELGRRINASAIADTALISLTAQGETPERARILASDVARAFVREGAQDARADVAAQRREIEQRIAALEERIEREQSGGGASGSERIESLRLARAALTEQLADVLGASPVRRGAVSLTAPPTAGDEPVQPRPLLNLLAALVLGSLLGLALAWLRVRSDTTIRSSVEVGELVGVPLLGSIPARRSRGRDRASRTAYDALHADVMLSGPADGVEVLAVGSPSSRDGKTSVAAGLAEAAARAGRDVLAIDGDLREKDLSRRWSRESARGLIEVVLGVEREAPVVRVDVPGHRRVHLLPAGLATPNGVLDRTALWASLAQLREGHDAVIIDTPSAHEAPDAAVLAAVSDRVLLVVRAGHTQRADLVDLATRLRHHRARIAGVVVIERNRALPRSASAPHAEREWPARAQVGG